MWPGDQHGGRPDPHGTPPQRPQGPYGPPNPNPYPNPYAQPGTPPPAGPPPGPPGPAFQPTQPYGTHNPYAQPSYPPSQAGHPTPQTWGPPQPGRPDGSRPPGDHRNRTITIAIVTSVAVIAAAVVTAVYLTRGGDKKNDANSPSPAVTIPTATPTTPTPSPTATDPAVTGGSGDSPRGAPTPDLKPVIPGWKVVKRAERNAVFDVPPDWSVGDEGLTIGFEDKNGNPAVAMGAPAYYKHDWCKNADGSDDRATAGTKGANGASSVRNAAEVQATSWAYWAYQDKGRGTFSKALDSRAFHNAHGITGWQAQATAANIPRTSRCSSDGEAYAVAWIDPTQQDPTKRLVVWVLYRDRGVPDQLSDATIDRIKSSIRLLNTT